MTFDSLTDLSTHPDPEIRNFSGTTIYRCRFNLSNNEAAKPLFLDLGKVGIIATVSLNAGEVGTVWTAPWEIDLTSKVRPGKNTLEIRVANTWNNRLAAGLGMAIR
jgi:hypothetical protein